MYGREQQQLDGGLTTNQKRARGESNKGEMKLLVSPRGRRQRWLASPAVARRRDFLGKLRSPARLAHARGGRIPLAAGQRHGGSPAPPAAARRTAVGPHVTPSPAGKRTQRRPGEAGTRRAIGRCPPFHTESCARVGGRAEGAGRAPRAKRSPR